MTKLIKWLNEPASKNMLKILFIGFAVIGAINLFEAISFFHIHKIALGVTYSIDVLLCAGASVIYGLAFKRTVKKEEK